jgi:hypothetical protein
LEVFNMRKVLAITVALMIAAIVSMPALGYTTQTAGNQAFTATSGARVGFSIASGAAGHNLTPDMVTSESLARAPAVQSNRVAYSIKQGTAMPYSVNLMGEGYQTQAPVVLGSVAAMEETQIMPAPETVEAIEAAPIVEAVDTNMTVAPEVVVPKFTIEGMAFNDADGNSTMENNETVLANWTINLEQPAGNVIMSANTSIDGTFAFSDLYAGEYIVSEVLMTGWRYVYPSDGKFAVNVTDTNVSGLVFANQLMPTEAVDETIVPTEAVDETIVPTEAVDEIIVPTEAEDVTVPSNDAALIDATVA